MTITVSCPSCETSFPVDPAKVPAEGVRAQCSSCPEIFDVNPPGEATPEAPPAEAPIATDTIEASDPLDAAFVDPPALEETPDEPAAVEPIAEVAAEVEDFSTIELAIEEPQAAEPAAEVVEPAVAPVVEEVVAAPATPAPDPEARGRRSGPGGGGSRRHGGHPIRSS
jgi:predicted Zn finger-like uncharacterized protein